MPLDAAAACPRNDERGLGRFLPKSLTGLDDPQKDIPRLAKDVELTEEIGGVLPPNPYHASSLLPGCARNGTAARERASRAHFPPLLDPQGISPDGRATRLHRRLRVLPCGIGQGMAAELSRAAPGGRLICVVGDVCLSRRKNDGRHTVVPLHASIQEHCRGIGFDNLAPIIWHKIANAQFEAEGNGANFLGKPYEPNAVIKNDIEFILMERKPGGYRTPDLPTRILSIIAEANHKAWFQQIWTGLTGASTRHHPAPFPLELATRLIRMFSFVGDTVLDPFLGTGTTTLAAAQCGRDSVGVELDPSYFEYARQRILGKTAGLFATATLQAHP